MNRPGNFAAQYVDTLPKWAMNYIIDEPLKSGLVGIYSDPLP
jgi:hypothetical protein